MAGMDRLLGTRAAIVAALATIDGVSVGVREHAEVAAWLLDDAA